MTRTAVAELEEDRVVAIGLQAVKDTQERLLLAGARRRAYPPYHGASQDRRR